MQKIPVGPEEEGSRLDRLLRKRLALLPLSQIYSLIRTGKVRVGGKRCEQNYRLQQGDLLEVAVDAAELTAPNVPEPSRAAIVNTEFFKRNFSTLYEDEYLLACNKPTGLVVHPGTGHTRHDSLIELATGYLLAQKGGIPAGDEPVLVHRLDRDTSGVILIAKNKRTVRQLHELFVHREIEKEYRAICHNRPPEYEGQIVVNLTRTHGRDRGTKMLVSGEGQQSRSRYTLLSFQNDRSDCRIYLDTGKTHQIRVHMAHLGAPVIGDERYGDAALDAKLPKAVLVRLYLHAHQIQFKHPFKKKSITITAPLPPEFVTLMNYVD